MTGTSIYKINYNQQDTHRLESKNIEQFVQKNNITRTDKLNGIIYDAFGILRASILGDEQSNDYEALKGYFYGSEILLKKHVTKFFDKIENTLTDFVNSKDKTLLDDLMCVEFEFNYLGQDTSYLVEIVKPEYELDDETRFIANSVYTYFHKMLLNDLLENYVIPQISKEIFQENEFFYSTWMLTIWIGCGLTIASSAVNDLALDYAENCIDRAQCYLDAQLQILPVLAALIDSDDNKGNLESNDTKKSSRERDVFTPIIKKILLDSNFEISDGQMFDVIFNQKPEVLFGSYKAGKIDAIEGRVASESRVSYGSTKYYKKSMTTKTKKLRAKLKPT